MMRSLAALIAAVALIGCGGVPPTGTAPPTTPSVPASLQPGGLPTSALATAATQGPNDTVPPATPRSPDLSAHPLIWFTPHPEVRLPDFNKGSADYFELFEPDAAWARAADHIEVFKAYDNIGVARDPTDAELRTVIEGARARGMALALELGPLPHPEGGGTNTTCGLGVEGFSAPFSLTIVQRIAALGGRVDLVAFDEPLAHGHFYDGPNACKWSVERVAAEVAAFVRELRALQPGVIIGDIEPAWISPEIGAPEIAGWLDAYAAAAGEPLGFFHLDLDWNRPDWQKVALAIERDVRARGVPSGIIYNGGETATSDAQWLQLSAERAYEYEQVAGGRPDQVVFQSWHFYPTRVLPDTDGSAFTSLINRYFGRRTTMAMTSPDEVTLRTSDGGGVPLANIAVDAQPIDGPYQELILGGAVPNEATRAVAVLRVNSEEAGPGRADFNVYEVSYTEGAQNLISNPRFAAGLNGWVTDGPGKTTVVASDHGSGRMLRVRAAPDQSLHVDSVDFAVSSGATFEFRVAVGVPLDSARSAYAAIIFLAASEADRQVLSIAPVPVDLGSVITSVNGQAVLDTTALQPGRYVLRARYAGDLENWPARLEQEIDV